MARLHGEARPAASEVRGNDAIAARLRVSEGRRQGPLVFPPARRRCFLGDLGALSLGQARRSRFTAFSAKLSGGALPFRRDLLGDLAGRDLRRHDGSAYHVAGTLLALRSFRHDIGASVRRPSRKLFGWLGRCRCLPCT